MTAHAKNRRRLLPTLSLLSALLAVYVLCVGPAHKFCESGRVPFKVAETVYMPLDELWKRSAVCRSLLDGYLELWQ